MAGRGSSTREPLLSRLTGGGADSHVAVRPSRSRLRLLTPCPEAAARCAAGALVLLPASLLALLVVATPLRDAPTRRGAPGLGSTGVHPAHPSAPVAHARVIVASPANAASVGLRSDARLVLSADFARGDGLDRAVWNVADSLFDPNNSFQQYRDDPANVYINRTDGTLRLRPQLFAEGPPVRVRVRAEAAMAEASELGRVLRTGAPPPCPHRGVPDGSSAHAAHGGVGAADPCAPRAEGAANDSVRWVPAAAVLSGDCEPWPDCATLLLEKCTYDERLDGYPGAPPGCVAVGGAWKQGEGRDVVKPVTSGRIDTRGKLEFAYGRLEVEARLPAGDWLWPAFWLLGATGAYGPWPLIGEIDLVESRGNAPGFDVQGQGAGRDVVASSLHYGANWWFHNLQAVGTAQLDGGADDAAAQPPDFSERFHTFGLFWANDSMYTYVLDRRGREQRVLDVTQGMRTGFFDGPLGRGAPKPSNPRVARDETSDVLRGTADPYAGAPANAPFDLPFYLVLNVAVGDLRHGCPECVPCERRRRGEPRLPRCAYPPLAHRDAHARPPPACLCHPAPVGVIARFSRDTAHAAPSTLAGSPSGAVPTAARTPASAHPTARCTHGRAIARRPPSSGRSAMRGCRAGARRRRATACPWRSGRSNFGNNDDTVGGAVIIVRVVDDGTRRAVTASRH